jgi:hypothetical protein
MFSEAFKSFAEMFCPNILAFKSFNYLIIFPAIQEMSAALAVRGHQPERVVDPQCRTDRCLPSGVNPFELFHFMPHLATLLPYKH